MAEVRPARGPGAAKMRVGDTVELLEISRAWLIDPVAGREGPGEIVVRGGILEAVTWLGGAEAEGIRSNGRGRRPGLHRPPRPPPRTWQRGRGDGGLRAGRGRAWRLHERLRDGQHGARGRRARRVRSGPGRRGRVRLAGGAAPPRRGHRRTGRGAARRARGAGRRRRGGLLRRRRTGDEPHDPAQRAALRRDARRAPRRARRGLRADGGGRGQRRATSPACSGSRGGRRPRRSSPWSARSRF